MLIRIAGRFEAARCGMIFYKDAVSTNSVLCSITETVNRWLQLRNLSLVCKCICNQQLLAT